MIAATTVVFTADEMDRLHRCHRYDQSSSVTVWTKDGMTPVERALAVKEFLARPDGTAWTGPQIEILYDWWRMSLGQIMQGHRPALKAHLDAGECIEAAFQATREPEDLVQHMTSLIAGFLTHKIDAVMVVAVGSGSTVTGGQPEPFAAFHYLPPYPAGVDGLTIDGFCSHEPLHEPDDPHLSTWANLMELFAHELFELYPAAGVDAHPAHAHAVTHEEQWDWMRRCLYELGVQARATFPSNQ